MTDIERSELRVMLASIIAQRQALEADTPTEPAESPCEDEATEWGEDTPDARERLAGLLGWQTSASGCSSLSETISCSGRGSET